MTLIGLASDLLRIWLQVTRLADFLLGIVYALCPDVRHHNLTEQLFVYLLVLIVSTPFD
jgi:hypothetical protein